MKINQFAVVVALSMSTLTVRAADQPTLNEKLKPLEWTLGRWQVSTDVPNQGTFRLVVESKPDLGGTVIVQRYDVFDANNRLLQGGISLVSWRPEENGIVATGVGTADHGTSLLVKQTDDKWIWQSSGYNSKGKFGTDLSETTKIDENTMTVLFSHSISGGEVQPDRKFTLKRVTTSPEEEIVKLENELNDALVRGDIKAQHRILADGWTETEEDGAVTTKGSLIADLKSGKLKSTYAKLSQPKVKVYGDAAVITFQNAQKGSYDGKEISGEYRITDTWIKRDGRWQMVAAHVSKIAKE
jgi:hypothetical protein